MNLFRKLFQVKDLSKVPLVKIYSHPRSGTHFIEAFVARNFYPDKDLNLTNVEWGHWSNRKVNKEGNKYGKLFGNHYFPNAIQNDLPKIYIFRDGRAVAYSIWKTQNFLNPKLDCVDFDTFIRMEIDWEGSPSKRAEEKYTIFEHWARHLESWLRTAEEQSNILLIQYENLIDQPFTEYLRIHKKYFQNNNLKEKNEIDIIKEPVGLLPNKAEKDAWKEILSTDGNLYFKEICKKFEIDFY